MLIHGQELKFMLCWLDAMDSYYIRVPRMTRTNNTLESCSCSPLVKF